MKKKLDILYEDKYIIIVNKPAGLLTVSTNKEKERTLFHYVYEYLKNKNKNNKVFIVHRLDKDTSGIVMFAKDTDTKFYLQRNWDKVKRGYVALVHGSVKSKDVLKNYLMETKTLITYSVKDSFGKLAILEYEKVLENDKYSLVSIDLKTGRKNQIRVQFSDINHPIVGDYKYGKKDGIRRLCLHANYMSFMHPKTKKEIQIDIDIPDLFIKLVCKKCKEE